MLFLGQILYLFFPFEYMDESLEDDMFVLEISIDARFSDEELDDPIDSIQLDTDIIEEKTKANKVDLPEAYEEELCHDTTNTEKNNNNRKNIISLRSKGEQNSTFAKRSVKSRLQKLDINDENKNPNPQGINGRFVDLSTNIVETSTSVLSEIDHNVQIEQAETELDELVDARIDASEINGDKTDEQEMTNDEENINVKQKVTQGRILFAIETYLPFMKDICRRILNVCTSNPTYHL